MADQKEQTHVVTQFREGLTRVVELGYGDDDCDNVVTVLFEELVRDVVPQKQVRQLPFSLPISQYADQITHAQLLHRAKQLQGFVERNDGGLAGDPGRQAVLFPFLTTLGISGGVFLLSVHVARLAPIVLQNSVG